MYASYYWLGYVEWFEAIFEFFGSAFLKKIEVKGGQGVKKWEFWETKIFLKYQLFIRFNYVIMSYGQFPTKSSLKLRFVLFKPEKGPTQQRSPTPIESRLSQI